MAERGDHRLAVPTHWALSQTLRISGGTNQSAFGEADCAHSASSLFHHPRHLGDLTPFSEMCLISRAWLSAVIPLLMLGGFVFVDIPMLDAHPSPLVY